MKTHPGFFKSVIATGLFTSAIALASAAPDCLDSQGQALKIDDAQVLVWKQTTPNQTLKRAHVSGPVTALYPDHSGHNHFEIKIGSNAGETLEVVYNISFGQLTGLKIGDEVEACGDYITSNAPTSQYPASPDNAIIHWIHRNPSGRGHASGFTLVNGILFGQGNGTGG